MNCCRSQKLSTNESHICVQINAQNNKNGDSVDSHQKVRIININIVLPLNESN